MLGILFFQIKKIPDLGSSLPWVDKLTRVDCWILQESSSGKTESGYLHYLVVSFLCVEYFRSVAKPPTCCDGIVKGERYLGPWVFPMPSGSELLIFNVHTISGFFVKGSDIVGLVQCLSFCISNKLVREADHFMNGKVLVHIPWGTVYEIASLWSQRQQISSHS